MTSLLIYIKHHCPWFWERVEQVNGWLFDMLYPDLSVRAGEILKGHGSRDFKYALVEETDIPALSRFLNGIPAEHLVYFNPHAFNEKTLRRLVENRAFLMMKVTRRDIQGPIVGYFFLRCFFVGKAFHGLLVDKDFCNQGLGTSMWALSMEICRAMNLRMFASVSIHNIASLHSVSKATRITIMEELPGDYRLIECTSKRDT